MSSKAALTVAMRIVLLSPEKLNLLCKVGCFLKAHDKCTSPTGFVFVAPPGPATPVHAIAISALEFPNAPSAIDRATSSLTAPY